MEKINTIFTISSISFFAISICSGSPDTVNTLILLPGSHVLGMNTNAPVLLLIFFIVSPPRPKIEI